MPQLAEAQQVLKKYPGVSPTAGSLSEAATDGYFHSEVVVTIGISPPVVQGTAESCHYEFSPHGPPFWQLP